MQPRLKLGSFALISAVAMGTLLRAACATELPPHMQAVLDEHNSYRAKHCVPALAWSAELAASAQVWAERCNFDHDHQSPHGENLFWGTAGRFSPQSAVESWYEEITAHNFSSPELGEETGHFTQVVWKDSKHIGCGMAACRGNHYWVCRYSPAGNVSGRYRRNVPKPC